MQFDNLRARLFSLSGDLALVQTNDPCAKTTDAMKHKVLISELNNVNLLDRFI